MVGKRQTVFLAYGWHFTNIAPLLLCQKNLQEFTHPCCNSIITFDKSRRLFFMITTKDSFACCSFLANGNDVKKLSQQMLYPLLLICSVSFTTTDSPSGRCSFSCAPEYGAIFATYLDLTSTKTRNFIPYLSGLLGMKVIKEQRDFRAGVGNCFRLRAALRPWKLTEGRIWMLNLFAGRKLRYFSPKIVVIPKKRSSLLFNLKFRYFSLKIVVISKKKGLHLHSICDSLFLSQNLGVFSKSIKI